MNEWQLLGTADPRHLGEARDQAHWAAQIIAAVGNTFSNHQEDDSHTSMEWLESQRLLAGQYTEKNPSFRLGLDIGRLTFRIIDLEDSAVAESELVGNTLDGAYEWVESISRMLHGSDEIELHRPTYEMPEHPVHTGRETFSSAGRAQEFLELEHWFSNASLMLHRVIQDVGEASPIRCWPHHFDIAFLAYPEPGTGKSIGVGMTPGDTYYPDPYWYVTPWPYPPEDVDLPVLNGGGRWHTEGWTGSILRGTDLVLATTAAEQEQQCIDFLQSAIAACETILT